MRVKKISILVSFIFAGYALIAQSDWTHISTPGINYLIADEAVSYRYFNESVGSHGSKYNLYKSVDGGHNFTLVATKTGDFGCYSIDELFVLDAQTVFYAENCQGSSVIYKSTDGGENWVNTGMGGAFSMSMYFLREDFGYYSFFPGPPNDSYLIRNGTLAYTTTRYVFANGYPSYGQTTEIYFKNDSTGLIMCRDSLDKSVILGSANYGNAWDEQYILAEVYFNDMQFINDSEGFIAGDTGFLLKTSNFGDAWEQVNLNFTNNFHSIDLLENGTGYLAGSDGKLLMSTDMGDSWEEVESPSALDLVYVRAFDNGLVFVLDADGKLYNNQSGNSIVDRSIPSVNAFPNPVNDKLILATDDDSDITDVILYDLGGRILLQNKAREIDFAVFEQGVYILEVRTNNGIITKRIIKN
jgi:photosystem II stability/assembly factor-like uncharacterized protein